MPNMAIFGLLKVIKAPVKYLLQKLNRKNPNFDLYLKKGRVQAPNCNLNKNSTTSNRYGLVLLEFNPNFWISKLDWRQKYPFPETSGQKNHNLRQISN